MGRTIVRKTAPGLGRGFRGLGPGRRWGEEFLSNDLFRPFWSRFPRVFDYDGPWCPRIDVFENEREMVVKADLPDVDPNDVSVETDGDSLTISGRTKEDKEEKDGQWYRAEREYGEFRRTIPLSSSFNADKISAETKNGLLTVRVPREKQKNKRTVNVKEAS